MIRVTPAPEPATFDEAVRQPGLRFVARELKRQGRVRPEDR